jgi:Amt family ammonium transporter
MGFRIPEESEVAGVDVTVHAESAYEFGSFTGGSYRITTGSTTTKESVDA